MDCRLPSGGVWHCSRRFSKFHFMVAVEEEAKCYEVLFSKVNGTH